MSRYTTGEMAKLCGVTVRTVQYYDTRNILVPSELSEGGRRLYSEEDLKKLKVICFLRELGISINHIEELLTGQNPGDIITVLLEQQKIQLETEVRERQEQIDVLERMEKEIKGMEHFTVESLNTVAYAVENKKKMYHLRGKMLLLGIPLAILQWTGLILGITSGNWWPTLVYVLLIIPYGLGISRFYFKRVVYICPNCHEIFRAGRKEAFWANHTPSLRKLTCGHCGYYGFCVETYGKDM